MALIEVKLLGELGRRFGRQYSFVADSPREVMSALCNQLEGFKQYMSTAHENGVGFRLVNDDPYGMDYDNVMMGCNRLIIAPIGFCFLRWCIRWICRRQRICPWQRIVV